MQGLGNTIDNNVLAIFGNKAPKGVINAIKQASTKTGVDFAYLMQQANAESSFDPHAKARTSSATGLYQFIESTWMRMVDKYGDKYGIETDGMSRREILDLRKDPEIASNLAAEFAGENERFLNDHWGGEVGSTELYLAHFLGAGGASAFLNAKDENPLQSGAVLFPAAAKANKNVFYDRATGRQRSMDEIYAFFDKKFQIKGESVIDPQFENEPASKTAPNQIASEALLAYGVDNSGFDHMAEAQIARNNFITSSVFRNGHKQLNNSYGQPLDNSRSSYGQIAAYNSLVRAPIEIMLLADLDVPLPTSDNRDSRI